MATHSKCNRVGETEDIANIVAFLVSRQRGTTAAGQQAEPIVELVDELIDGHGAQPDRGQFDRQRHPI